MPISWLQVQRCGPHHALHQGNSSRPAALRNSTIYIFSNLVVLGRVAAYQLQQAASYVQYCLGVLLLLLSGN